MHSQIFGFVNIGVDVTESVGEVTAEVVTALSAQLSDALAMVNESNRVAMDATDRAARAETERDHLKERLAEIRADLEAAQSTPQQKKVRWWNR